MSQRKRVLVLESEKLLPAAVLSLLAARSEFDVTSIGFNSFVSLKQVDHCEPDVIIMDEELVTNNITAVMRLVDRHPKVRLIVVGLEDNKLHVFDKHIVQIKNVSDFMAQI